MAAVCVGFSVTATLHSVVRACACVYMCLSVRMCAYSTYRHTDMYVYVNVYIYGCVHVCELAVHLYVCSTQTPLSPIPKALHSYIHIYCTPPTWYVQSILSTVLCQSPIKSSRK